MSRWSFVVVGGFLSASAALAAIPDRVNYQKFRDLYQTQKGVSDQARSESNAARNTYNHKTAARQALEAEKATLEDANRRDQETITRHKATIGTLTTEVSNKQGQATQNDQQIVNLQSTHQTLVNQIANKESDLQRQTQLVTNQEAVRLQAQNQLTSTQSKLTEAQHKIQVATTERDQWQAAFDKASQELVQLRNQLDQLRHEQIEIRDEMQKLPPVITQLATEVKAAEQKKTDLEAKKKTLEAKQNKTPAEVQELQRLTTELNAHLPVLAQLVARHHQTEGRLNHLRNLTAILRDQILIGQTEGIPAIDREIRNAQSEVDSAKQRIRQNTDLADEWAGFVTLRRQQFEAADQELARLNGVKKQMVAELGTLNASKTANENESARLSNENVSLRNRIAACQQQINTLNTSIGNYETAIAQRSSQISLTEVKINTAKNDESAAYQVYSDRDALATQEETKTGTAYSTYQGVLAQYNQELDAARVQGQGDGSAAGGKEGSERGIADGKVAGDRQGMTDGTARGDHDGRTRDYNAGFAVGKTRGLSEGTQKGTIDGQAQGLADGAQKGYADGLEEGREQGRVAGHQAGKTEGFKQENNAANKKIGFDAGVLKGIARAKDQAKREDYPRGRNEAEADILKSAPAQKIDIDNAPPPSAMKQVESLFKFALHRAAGVVIADAFAAPSNISVPSAIPDYRYKQYLHTYEHPDFDTAYQDAYNSTYDGSFQSRYRAQYIAGYGPAYDAAYAAAYATALAVPHADETQKGDGRGYQQGYNTNYRPAYDAAYESSYQTAYDTAHAKALLVDYQKGYDAGHLDGLAEGKTEGANHAKAEGEAEGEPKGYNDRIAPERQAAYAAGKADLTGEYQSSVKPKLLSVKLIDKNGDGKFEVWESAKVEMVVRNFGGRASADGELEGNVKDSRGNVLGSKLKNGLKALPANTEATYKSAIGCTPIGGYGGVKFDVQLLKGGSLVNELNVEQKVEQDLYVVFTNSQSQQPMLIGYPGQWFGNRLWIQNLSSSTVTGLKVKSTARGSIAIYENDWSRPATFDSIDPQGWGNYSISTRASQYGTFNDNSYIVEIKDKDDYLIYKGEVKAPTKVE